MSEFVEFQLVERKPKTVVFKALSKSGGFNLGFVKWFGRWRQYTFFPEPETVFSSGCLKFIIRFIDELNRKQRDGSIATLPQIQGYMGVDNQD